MRVCQKPERLELRELAPYGRGRHLHPTALDERTRADGLPGRNVLLDDAAQNLAFTSGKLHRDTMVAASPASLLSRRAVAQTRSSAVTPPPRKRPRRVSATVASTPVACSSTRPPS